MKSLSFLFAIIFSAITTPIIAQHCLEPEALKTLDLSWEQALLESDLSFFKTVLSEDFKWVHNHAGTIDTKTELLERASDPNRGATGKPKSRISKDITTIIHDNTGVITGFTIVDRGPTPVTYHFMRTYVNKEGKCFLIANQTMAVPDSTEE